MRMLCWTVVFVAAVIAACTSNPESTAPRRVVRFQSLTVTVDSDSANLATTDTQLVKGWGLYPGGGNNPFDQWPQAESLLYHMGLTFIRDQLDPALYDTGSTISDITLNSAQLAAYETKWDSAKVHGMGYMLSVWSPPAAWKDSPGLDSGRLDSATGRPSFVAFMTVVMRNLNGSAPGLPLALSIANEPDISNTHYPSTPYDTALYELTLDNTRGSLNFAGYTGVVTLGPEVSALNVASSYLGDASFTSIDSGYFASTAVGAFAVHTYGDVGWSALSSFFNSHKRDVWMTEYSQPTSRGTSQIAHAIDLMGALGAHFEILPTNYWAWWNGFAHADTDTTSSGTPGAGTLLLGHSNGSLEVTSMFYTLRKLFQKVTPGSAKVQYATSYYTKSSYPLVYSTSGQTGSQPRIDLYAFQETSPAKTIVVVSNWTSDDKRLTLIGLPSGYTTQQGYVSDSASTNADMIMQTASTCWTPSGQTVARTVLYAPARSVLVAVMN
jgi:hypothetical protein